MRGSLHTNFVRLLISRRTRHSRCLVDTQTVYRLMSVSVSAATLQLLLAAYTAIAGAVYLAYCPSLLHALYCIGIAVAKHRLGLYKQILPRRVCVWHFYPRDAMLTRVLAMTQCPCLSVCLSVTRRRCSVETDGRNNLVFGMGSSFNQSYAVF